MKKSWFIWFLILGVITAVFFYFNHKDGKNAVPLSEIFPEEETYPVDIEYEFVDGETPHEQAAEKAEPRVEMAQPALQKPEKPAAAAVAPDPDDDMFAIQVASFNVKSQAETALTKLKNKGYDAYIVTRDLKDKGTWYRVYVGKFSSKDSAKEFLTTFKQEYRDSFIILLPK